MDDCARNKDWNARKRTERDATKGLNSFFVVKNRVTSNATEIRSANACLTNREVPKIFIQVAKRKKNKRGWPFESSGGKADGVIPNP
jgi:hypothetical protein